jgi:hypothetical protein
MPNTSIPARDAGTQVTQIIYRPVTFADNGVARVVGTLPEKAVIINAGVVVTTAFNAGTSNVLDIGTSLDDDGFATDLALGTIGRIAADELATSDDLYSTSERTITATVALTGTAATAGAGIVFVEYFVNR